VLTVEMAFGKPVKQSSVVRLQQAIPDLKFQPDPSFLNEKTCQSFTYFTLIFKFPSVYQSELEGCSFPAPRDQRRWRGVMGGELLVAGEQTNLAAHGGDDAREIAEELCLGRKLL
jgi:hypothetical protein